jgi:hypothetical protein
MSWKDILKSYTREMMVDAFVELHKAVGVWVAINNINTGSKDDGSLSHELDIIKRVTFDNIEVDLMETFSKLEDMTDGDNDVRKPLWKLYHMLEWREGLQ